MKLLSKTLMAMTCSLLVSVAESSQTEAPAFLQDMSKVKGTREFPAASFRLVETDSGTFLMSENGRFVVKGPIYDLWQKESISSLADIDAKANRMDMNAFNLNFDEVVSLTLGEGESEVVMFVSSTDEVSIRQLGLINEALKKRFTFKLILLPENQPESMAELKRFGCNQNSATEQLAALLSRKGSTLTPSEHCPMEVFHRTLLTGKFIGVDHVPFTIAPDGRFGKGLINDLQSFLSPSEAS